MMSILVHDQAQSKPAHVYGPKKGYFCHFLFFLVFFCENFTFWMGLCIWLRAYFRAKTLGHTSRLLVRLWVPFRSILGCPNAPKQHRKTVFWLFWTISSTRMSLLIWLGPYFQAKILGRTSRQLGGLCKPFWVHLWVPKCPKTA